MDRNLFKKERQTVENDEIYLFLPDEGCKKFNTAFEKQNNRNCSSQTNRYETLYIIKKRKPSALRTAPARGKVLNLECAQKPIRPGWLHRTQQRTPRTARWCKPLRWSPS